MQIFNPNFCELESEQGIPWVLCFDFYDDKLKNARFERPSVSFFFEPNKWMSADVFIWADLSTRTVRVNPNKPFQDKPQSFPCLKVVAERTSNGTCTVLVQNTSTARSHIHFTQKVFSCVPFMNWTDGREVHSTRRTVPFVSRDKLQEYAKINSGDTVVGKVAKDIYLSLTFVEYSESDSAYHVVCDNRLRTPLYESIHGYCTPFVKPIYHRARKSKFSDYNVYVKNDHLAHRHNDSLDAAHNGTRVEYGKHDQYTVRDQYDVLLDENGRDKALKNFCLLGGSALVAALSQSMDPKSIIYQVSRANESIRQENRTLLFDKVWRMCPYHAF